MLFSPTTSTVIGNMGSIDQGRLWRFNIQTQKEDWIETGDASHLSISAGTDSLFRVVHHQCSNFKVSIRNHTEPSRELAAIHGREDASTFEGDSTLWDWVEPAFVTYVDNQPNLKYINRDRRQVLDLDLSWYSDGDYDRGYQGLADAITFRNDGLVVVSVQRSSKLVLIDVTRNKAIDHIWLAGRSGNPDLRLCSGRLFLASDYDTLCLVDLDDRKPRQSARLQESEAASSMQFIGEYDLDETGGILVARPFSGDVLRLGNDFRIIDRMQVGDQPLALCSTANGGFVVRDWQSGRLEMGSFASSKT